MMCPHSVAGHYRVDHVLDWPREKARQAAPAERASRAGMMRLQKEESMFSLDECIGMSDLSEEVIAVISEHEHVPEIVAVGLGQNLLKTPKGLFTLRCFICDALEHAQLAGKRDKVKQLERVLTRFNASYRIPRVL
jgi:hypothetical protein